MGDEVLWQLFLRVLAAALQFEFPESEVAVEYSRSDGITLSRHSPHSPSPSPSPSADAPFSSSSSCDCLPHQIPDPSFVVMGGGSILGTTLEYYQRLPLSLLFDIDSSSPSSPSSSSSSSSASSSFFSFPSTPPPLSVPTFVFGSGIDDYSTSLVTRQLSQSLQSSSIESSPPSSSFSSSSSIDCSLLDDPIDALALRAYLRLVHRAYGFLRDRFTAQQAACLAGLPAFSLPPLYDPGLLAAAYLPALPPSQLSQLPPQRVVALNVGHSARMLGGLAVSEDAVVRLYVEVASQLARARPVVLFSVFPGDELVARRVAHEIRRDRSLAAHQVTLLPAALEAEQVLGLMGRSELAIAFKLHAGVLAASAGVPFITLAYRAKSVGFAHSVGMGRYAFAFDTNFTAAQVVRAAEEMEGAQLALREALKRHVQRAAVGIESAVVSFLPQMMGELREYPQKITVSAGYFTNPQWIPQDHTCFGFFSISTE